MPDENDYEVKYGFGYAKYSHISNDIEQKLKVFIPLEDSLKVNMLNLKNLSSTKKTMKIIYYINPVLGEDEIKTNGNLEVKMKKNTNTILLKNRLQEYDEYYFVSCSEEIKSYTANKNFFLGTGTISDPEALKKVSLDNKEAFGEEEIVALQIEIELEAFESKELSFIIGTEKDKISCLDKAYQYSDIQKCEIEFEKIVNYWNNFINNLQVETPVESFNILVNGWLAYQTLACRLWAKSGFYQSGGAFGFRDQLQDTLGLKYYDTKIMKEQILKHTARQFIEGDVEHWWHEENNMGIRTRFTDDLLWLPYVVCEYIIQTGDYTLLDEEVEYIYGDILENGVDEKYDNYKRSNIKENIYKHCVRAIEKSINNLGKHGLPKIGSGDWNDSMSSVGSKGNGESVWLGFFLYDVLNKFTSIIEKSNSLSIINIALIEKYKKIQDKLKKALNSDGWDGRWYKRAYTDAGDELRKLRK